MPGRGARYEARIAGLKRYNTGKPCRFGHIADRFVANTGCVECFRLRFEKYRNDNPEKHRNAVRKFRKNNPQRRKEQEIRAHYKNKEKRNAYCREYGRKNRPRLNELRNEYYRKHPEKRAGQKLADLLRTRLRIAVGKNQRKGSAVRDLGCSIEEFKAYIASKFYGDMSWHNHGVRWHLDHIRPLASFDLTKRSQLLQAVHFTNLQPLSLEHHKLKTREDTT